MHSYYFSPHRPPSLVSVGELNRAILLDLPSPDFQACHDYHTRVQQQGKVFAKGVVPQFFYNGLDMECRRGGELQDRGWKVRG